MLERRRIFMFPHHTPAALQQFTKIHKVCSFASCKSIRCCHAPQIPIRAIFPYHQSDPTFAKTCAGFGRSTEHSWRIVTPAGLIPAETSDRFTRIHASNRFTQILRSNDVRGGPATAMRRRQKSCVQVDLKAGACGPRHGSPRNLDRLDSTKVRRCGARTTGSAGRVTDHVGRRPDPTQKK